MIGAPFFLYPIKDPAVTDENRNKGEVYMRRRDSYSLQKGEEEEEAEADLVQEKPSNCKRMLEGDWRLWFIADVFAFMITRCCHLLFSLY